MATTTETCNMNEMVGAVLALVLVACFAVLVAYVVFMSVASASTIRGAKSDARLRADLDRVLEEILGQDSNGHRVN